MTKQVHRLTEAAAEKARAGTTRREIPDGGGLYLIVHPTGLKTWAVRYRRDGKPRKHTIAGTYPNVGLKAARTLAKAAVERVAHGGDPAAEKVTARRIAADRKTDFESVAAEFLARYINKKRARPRPRTLDELARHLGLAPQGGNWGAKKGGLADRWKGRKVSEITRGDILARLDDQVARGIGANANRLRAALLLFFGWCLRRGLVASNPVIGIDRPAAETPRDRILTDDELRLFWQASGEDRLFGPLWRVLALTGQRRDEARGMTRGEIDEDDALWTIPGARTKNGREHAVPLASPALNILKAQPRIGGKRGLLFTTTGEGMLGGLSRAKARLDARMLALARETNRKAKIAPWVIHDLRRTAASGMARLGISLPVIEKVLNHTSGSFAGIVGIYQRHEFLDEKRAALDAWARHVQSLTSGTVNNVVPIKGRV